MYKDAEAQRASDFPVQRLANPSAADLRLKASSVNPRIILKFVGKICGNSFSEQALIHPEKLLSHKLPAVKGVCLTELDLEFFMVPGFVGVKRALNLES